jgi:hypothetical protein
MTKNLDVQLQKPITYDAKKTLEDTPAQWTKGTDFCADEIHMQGTNPTKKGVQL